MSTFKRWGATTGASSASGSGYSKSDGTLYQSPIKEKKDKVRAVPASKSSPSYKSSPSPSSSSSFKSTSSSKPSPSPPVPARSSAPTNQPEVVKCGLPTTTYEQQPAWAVAERDKHYNGQYHDGKFRSVQNDAPGYKAQSNTVSSSPSYSKPQQSSASYSTSSSSSPTNGVVKCSLNATTYEKQPAWATAEQHKNVNGQYKDSMFQSKNNDAPRAVASPVASRVGGSNTTSYSSSSSASSSPKWGNSSSSPSPKLGGGNPKCNYCGKTVYAAEKQLGPDGTDWHTICVSADAKSKSRPVSAFESYRQK